jgi:hypothetical protein
MLESIEFHRINRISSIFGGHIWKVFEILFLSVMKLLSTKLSKIYKTVTNLLIFKNNFQFSVNE